MSGNGRSLVSRKRSGPKQSLALAACKICSARKVSCDGKRPRCSRCVKRREVCVYATANIGETRVEALKREISELRSRERAVSSAVKRLSTLPSVLVAEAIAAAAADPDPGAALLRSLATMGSHAHRPIESPLSASLLRGHVYSKRLQALPRGMYYGLPELDDVVLQCLEPAEVQRSALPFQLSERSECPVAEFDTATRCERAPHHAQTAGFFCSTCYDSRLHDLQIDIWTRVSISNDLAAMAFSLYLSLESPVHACFDPDLFLRDLVSGQMHFCSRLLVHVLLYYSCKMCALEETTAGSLSNAFLAEIREILRVPLLDQAVTTQIASFQLLSLALFTDDLIEEAIGYQEKAVQLANRLNVEFASRFEGSLESEYAQSVQYTLWGTFSTSIFWAMFERRTTASDIPHCTIPDLTSERVGLHHARAQSARQVFILRCQLCSIVGKFHQYFISNSTPSTRTTTLEAAFRFYEQLLGWADCLPLIFETSHNVPDHVHVLRMFFHVVVMDLFRPFLRLCKSHIESSSSISTAKSIFHASAKQLVYVFLVFTEQHRSARIGTVWMFGLVYAVNVSLALVDKQKALLVLRRCLTILLDLTHCFHHPRLLVRSVLSLALRAGIMGMREARTFHHALGEDLIPLECLDEGEPAFVDNVDWTTEMPSMESKRVEALAVDFQQRVLFHEFTMESSLPGEFFVEALTDLDERQAQT